uniref:Uncharacterized protein n=1 Tax=Oryza sativa subsp. japonica TaxID=39947 RepID=Q5Z614_ORYSJ|nr:hypothetical protein [Oryza sativa Japonica Group]BAD61945.1 hypothetical protein [Oryza sativa Japonica Group]
MATGTEQPLSVGAPAGEGSGNGKNGSHAWPAQQLTTELEVVGEGLRRKACKRGVGAPARELGDVRREGEEVAWEEFQAIGRWCLCPCMPHTAS